MFDDGLPFPAPAGARADRDPGLRKTRERRGPALRIGLLNLMPDAALVQTERQFRALVGPDHALALFAVREIARGPAAEAYLDEHYAAHHTIGTAALDGLIITGSEPKEARLKDEPFFPPLSAVVDWAAANAVSVMFSCLASHAAVLHLDGIRRVPLPAKYSGVFDCRAVAAHPLLTGMPDTVSVPHSRWNDLSESDLAERGYLILRRSGEVGVDLFVREEGSLFVFLQGHPEYEPRTLAREYRRDMARFLAGTSGRCPAVPANYFAQDAVAAPGRPSASAEPGIDAAVLPDPGTLPLRPAAWRSPAAQLFRNWLVCVARQRGVGTERVVA